MSLRKALNDWSEVAVSMDRGLRIFADFAKPILKSHSADNLSLSNLLFLISVGEGEARVNDIVKRGRYVGSNASYALKALQDGGYIDRRQDPDDRRNGVISWTDRGRSLIRDIKSSSSVEGTIPREAIDIVIAFETHCSRVPNKR